MTRLYPQKQHEESFLKWETMLMIFNPILALKDDPSKHGVLGDILSPTKTEQGVNKILEWIRKNN